MYRDRTVAVVVPAFNEESQVGRVVETLPAWVDQVFVVDDGSTDATAAIVQGLAAAEPARVKLVRLDANRGVGAAIEAGYRRAFGAGSELVAVLAGDGQMDPDELSTLLDPLVEREADYTKGNRLILGTAWQSIPHVRLLGNAAISVLTKIASGYWHVADSQNGYTAITRPALEQLLKAGIYPRYGMPNDVLVKLNVHNFRVRDVPMQAVYGVGEQSKMKVSRVFLPIAGLLVRRFFYRLWDKYVVRDTHPLVLFYLLGLVLAPLGFLYGLLILLTRVIGPTLLGVSVFDVFRPICSDSGIVLCAVVTLAGLQMLLFAMWFDMQDNARLR